MATDTNPTAGTTPSPSGLEQALTKLTPSMNLPSRKKPEKSSNHYASSRTPHLAPLNQILINLSDTNTQSLLSSASDVLRSISSQAVAASILERLQMLNPTIASQFYAKAEAIAGLPLRMLVDHDYHSHVSHASSETTPAPATAPEVDSFLVVSYCWHYPGWPLAEAATPIAEGWEVSRPMVDAVMSLRESKKEGVWLDKLCIDQSSDQDKMSHIGAMDVVYRSARRMVILLEDVQLTPAEEAAGLAYAKFYEDMGKGITGLEGAARSKFFNEYFPSREKAARDAGQGQVLEAGHAFTMKLLGARWYSRAWCAHEARITPHKKINNPLFLCFGADGRVLTFEFRVIHYVAMYLSEQEPQVDLTSENALRDALNDPNPKTLRQRWWRIQRLMPDGGDNISAMQHLISILSFGCFMKGDLMSIALNTSGIPLFFMGDAVKEVEDVIWIFSLLVIAAGDIVPLATMGPRLKVPDGHGNETISWMTRPMQGAIDDKMSTPRLDSISAVTKDYVELDLLLFTSQPRTASPESLAVAARIIEEHDLAQLARDFTAAADASIQRNVNIATSVINSRGGNRPDGPLNVFLKVWLGMAIDAGLSWILWFPDVMMSGTATWQDGIMGENADGRLADAASSLLAHFDTLEGKQNLDSMALHKVIRFMNCVVDPRLPLLHAAPRRLPVGLSADGEEDFAITPTVSDHSYVAVPVAMAHLPDWQNRAWVIEPFDPTAPPEDPASHLPCAPTKEELAASGKKPAELLAVEVYPILRSDEQDRREKRDDERATWRLRKLHPFYGCQDLMKEVEDEDEDEEDEEKEELPSKKEVSGKPKRGKWRSRLDRILRGTDRQTDSEPAVVLLRNQRVYGADDYDWAAIQVAGIKMEEDLGLRPKAGSPAEGHVEAQAEVPAGGASQSEG